MVEQVCDLDLGRFVVWTLPDVDEYDVIYFSTLSEGYEAHGGLLCLIFSHRIQELWFGMLADSSN